MYMHQENITVLKHLGAEAQCANFHLVDQVHIYVYTHIYMNIFVYLL